eukprot:TRINITY_DN16793_c0_g1_i2.p1 TRINITY_DN16793_c0_g1~~TRINITY_DN16793_c0_g1_i2.p1  ORF type:complete len:359 (+),score=68.10 TRINITY_DN16793_c0_g1_i2:64-1077(+)
MSLPEDLHDRRSPSPSPSRSRSGDRHQRHHHHHHHHHHKHHRVGELVAQRQTPLCPGDATMGDACDAMVEAGRTATVIVDKHGGVAGVLTENDMLAAVMDGTSRDLCVDLWLRSGSARLPSFMVPSLTLSHKVSLVEAADVMAAEAEKDSGFACHHVIVSHSHHKPRLLSALDVARGIIGDPKDKDEAHAAHMKVTEAMKRRADMTICKLSDKLIEAYRVMSESRQNCVLVVAGLGDVEGETDAVRTFSECQKPEHTTVAGWLRGLTAEEHATAPQRSILETQTLSEAAEIMNESGMHHLVVLAPSKGEVVGVLSALDVVCALARQASSGSGKAGGA